MTMFQVVHPTIMGENAPPYFFPKDEAGRAKWLKKRPSEILCAVVGRCSVNKTFLAGIYCDG